MISQPNTIHHLSNVDLYTPRPEPVTDHLHIAVYSLAELFRADPAAAMRIADKSRADHEATLISSVLGKDAA